MKTSSISEHYVLREEPFFKLAMDEYVQAIVSKGIGQVMIKDCINSEVLINRDICVALEEKLGMNDYAAIAIGIYEAYCISQDFDGNSDWEDFDKFIDVIVKQLKPKKFTKEYQEIQIWLLAVAIVNYISLGEGDLSAYVFSLAEDSFAKSTRKDLYLFVNAYGAALPDIEMQTETLLAVLSNLLSLTESKAQYNMNQNFLLEGIRRIGSKKRSEALKLLYLSEGGNFVSQKIVSALSAGLYDTNGIEFLDEIIQRYHMVYFSRLREYFPMRRNKPKRIQKLNAAMKNHIMGVITTNSGFTRPLLDNHSIPMVQLFSYFSIKAYRRKEDINFVASYFLAVIEHMAVMKGKRGLLPEFHNNMELLLEAMATGMKPPEYTNESSMLLAMIFELLAIFNSKEMYAEAYKHFSEGIDFQIPTIDFGSFNVEELLFEKHLHKEYHVEMLTPLLENYEEYIKQYDEMHNHKIVYRTDIAGYPFLRYLAHSYFKNELLPEEWRIFINN